MFGSLGPDFLIGGTEWLNCPWHVAPIESEWATNAHSSQSGAPLMNPVFIPLLLTLRDLQLPSGLN